MVKLFCGILDQRFGSKRAILITQAVISKPYHRHCIMHLCLCNKKIQAIIEKFEFLGKDFIHSKYIIEESLGP